MKKDNSFSSFKHKIAAIGLQAATFVTGVIGQIAPVRVPRQEIEAPAEDFTWWYVTLFVLVVGLLTAVTWWYKTKMAAAENGKKKDKRDEWDDEALDADKELEWFKSISKSSAGTPKQSFPKGLPKTSKVLGKKPAKPQPLTDLEQKERRVKLEQGKFRRLPINSITGLEGADAVQRLPLSNDQGLLSAIEQAQDEYEDDVEIRQLALRVLAKFRNRNSIDALSQIAMYDVSASLRSNAVTALAEFDHESVFESILLACADPTREVRAAAAKSLFRLSADRAAAWTRIAECDDEFRIIRAARAAIESELVDRSIDRLVHEDHKYAYEAFALVALLVKAGETKEIFDVIENRRDNSVKLAILHCLKVLKDQKTLPDLYTYMERNSLPEDLSNAANEVIKSVDLVAA